jgi:sugar lactone lactonase YvrE
VPARRPTCVCAGGGTLFVSTDRFGITDPAPFDGAVLYARTGASAPPAAAFRLA